MVHPGSPLGRTCCAGARRLRRWQLRLVDDQHQRVLPAAAEGLGAGRQRRWRQHRRAGIQIVGLLVIATLGQPAARLVCAVYLVPLTVAASAPRSTWTTWSSQDRPDRDGRILKERDTWVISLLYIGTFGSFIGFAFAFGQVLQINFAAGSAAQASLHAAQIRSSGRCSARSHGCSAASSPTASAAAGSRSTVSSDDLGRRRSW